VVLLNEPKPSLSQKLLENGLLEVEQRDIAFLGAHAQQSAFPAIQEELRQQRSRELITNLAVFLRLRNTSLKKLGPGSKVLSKAVTSMLLAV